MTRSPFWGNRTLKKTTYANHGDDFSLPSLVPGSIQLEFAEGDFLYRDIYFGSRTFAGIETVYQQGTPIWSMVYSGGVTASLGDNRVKEIYSFLREALRRVDFAHPFRGPGEFSSGEYVYANSHSGNVHMFRGEESYVSGLKSSTI
jgi:hypothetical protein